MLKKFFLTAFISALICALYFLVSKKPYDFKYIILNCYIWDTDGRLVYAIQNYPMCDTGGKDGRYLVSSDARNEFALFDKGGNKLWRSYEMVTHWPKFSKSGDEILAIGTEVKNLPEMNESENMDSCLTRRTLSNKIISKFCYQENLNQFKAFNIDPVNDYVSWDKKRKKEMSEVGYRMSLWERKHKDEMPELSHTNSIWEIEPNSRAKSSPAFAPGNYIVNAYWRTESIYILDHELKKVLWAQKLSGVKIDGLPYTLYTHDVSVQANGNLLMYLNAATPDFNYSSKIKYIFDSLSPHFDSVRAIAEVPAPLFSRIVEYNPDTKEVVWSFSFDKFADFYAEHLGVIRVLRNGNILFSYNKTCEDEGVMCDGAAIIINRKGEVLWTMDTKVSMENGRKPELIILEPLYGENEFLKSLKL